ncbi:hypothetical protein BSKO_08123 [Bryopsis sp. KO-2023]|nr:hypothetical protein BSKO_08123 [Bryopsis sp. KO-2023]
MECVALLVDFSEPQPRTVEPDPASVPPATHEPLATSPRSQKRIVEDAYQRRPKQTLAQALANTSATQLAVEWRALANRHLEPATQATYQSRIRQYVRTCELLDLPPFPPTLDTLASWIATQTRMQLQFGTIDTGVTALVDLCTTQGWPSPRASNGNGTSDKTPPSDRGCANPKALLQLMRVLVEFCDEIRGGELNHHLAGRR